MLALQFAIGALNDVVDAPRDAIVRPGKPVAAGRVRSRTALMVSVTAAVVGLALAATRGLPTLAVAGVGLATGLLYDLRLKATPLSWLPFSIGVPLIPIFAWLGATGDVPAPVLGLAALAVPAGAGLAIANALADVPADNAAGIRTVATSLGPAVAWLVATGLLGATLAVSVVALVVAGAGPGSPGVAAPAGSLAWSAIAAAAVLLGVGAWLDRGPGADRRRLGWGTEGVALATLACGWIGALAAAGRI
jgi:4-hydroxybenzoate polyprenyltransferase